MLWQSTPCLYRLFLHPNDDRSAPPPTRPRSQRPCSLLIAHCLLIPPLRRRPLNALLIVVPRVQSHTTVGYFIRLEMKISECLPASSMRSQGARRAQASDTHRPPCHRSLNRLPRSHTLSTSPRTPDRPLRRTQSLPGDAGPRSLCPGPGLAVDRRYRSHNPRETSTTHHTVSAPHHLFPAPTSGVCITSAVAVVLNAALRAPGARRRSTCTRARIALAHPACHIVTLFRALRRPASPPRLYCSLPPFFPRHSGNI